MSGERDDGFGPDYGAVTSAINEYVNRLKREAAEWEPRPCPPGWGVADGRD